MSSPFYADLGEFMGASCNIPSPSVKSLFELFHRISCKKMAIRYDTASGTHENWD